MLTNQKKRRGKSKHRSGSMSMDLTFNILYYILKKDNAGSLEEQIEIDTFNMKKENVIGIGIVSDYLN